MQGRAGPGLPGADGGQPRGLLATALEEKKNTFSIAALPRAAGQELGLKPEAGLQSYSLLPTALFRILSRDTSRWDVGCL